MKRQKKGKVVSYNKWGYIFLIPFVLVYIIFQFIPLVTTVVNSFFENYRSGLTQIGPNFIGLKNYAAILQNADLWIYTKNTLIMWVMGFLPQILVSLLLGAWFSNPSLRLKGQRFFKTVIYLPNLIMASAFAMLFFTLFSNSGPVNSILMQLGFISEPYKFLANPWSARTLVAFMNF
ncbi:MAG: sugar ABC transporter permease, partial [Lachnospiraceae bacterium]|nr:sugar ABC transporter permease [Lachnospiraceae bacterium]